MIGTEKRVQEVVIDKLESYEIYPFSVTYTSESNGIMSMTFFIRDDLEEVLEMLGYKRKCDKSGYEIIPETNTLILTGFAIIDALKKWMT